MRSAPPSSDKTNSATLAEHRLADSTRIMPRKELGWPCRLAALLQAAPPEKDNLLRKRVRPCFSRVVMGDPC